MIIVASVVAAPSDGVGNGSPDGGTDEAPPDTRRASSGDKNPTPGAHAAIATGAEGQGEGCGD